MTQEIAIIEVNNQYKRKSKPRLIALEPRMLFDGAAVATVVDSLVQVDQTEQATVDQNLTTETTQDVYSNTNGYEVNQINTDALVPAVNTTELTTISQPATSGRNELVVVDGILSDLQILLDDINRVDSGRTILVLDPATDETAQLIDFLSQSSSQYDAIHVLSHGGQGWIGLGDQILQLSTPEQNTSFWNAIKTSLTSSGDVLLYGCNVAIGAEGQAALDAVANITEADIAASTNVTGFSGDWVLESSNGSIEAETIAATNWQDNLVDPIVVADINVNEASPYAVFTVDGGYGTSVKLSLVLSGTTTSGATDNGTYDFNNAMQYWNGSSWISYVSGSIITIPSSTDLLVRVALYRQTAFEGPESFTLQVHDSSNVLQDSGIATIYDDGTGNVFTGETTPTDDSAAYYLATAAEKQAALDAWRAVIFDKSRVIVSSFHDAFYRAEDGGYYVSGESATATGTSTNTPIKVNPTNGYNYTGTIIDVAVVSMGINTGQYLLLTTDGLYAWGNEGNALDTALTASENFQKISDPSFSFDPKNVKSMTASYGGVMFLMKDGTVFSKTNATYGYHSGHPAVSGLSAVVDSSNKAIQGITDLEFSTYAAFAYSQNTGKFYTWGHTTYLGNGLAATGRTVATEMINPLPTGVSAVQIAVSNSTYYVLGSDGKVYVTGDNTYGTAGQGSTGQVLTWKTMRDTTGAVNTSLTNVQFLSASNSDKNAESIGLILRDGSVLALGDNSSYMLGIPTSTSNVLIPTAPSGSIVGQKAYTIEIGGHFSSVLLYGCTGVVSASGHNPGGAFGDGTRDSRTEFTETLFLGELDTACIEPVVLASPTLSQLADDRPLGVNDLTVNEGSPFAVFTVTGTVGKLITLALANGTASSTDYGASLRYFDGSTWVPYVSGSSVAIPSGGLLVRVSIIDDSQAEGAETFTLTASSAGTPSAFGTATINDDGTGDIFSGTSGTADINVSAGSLDYDQNHAPAGTDKTITLNEDATYTLSAADFGFTDPNDTPANTLQSVIIASLPGAGTLKLNGVDVTVGQTILAADIANLVYAPAANASGTSYANFTFKVVDNGGTANSGQNTDQSANTITFNVTAVNDPPVAVDDSYTMLEDGAAITLTPLTSDTDVENNTLTITSINGITLTPGTAQSISVTGGTVNVSTLGVITFIPASNFNGVVTFPYVISDGAGGTATANESITVTAVNDTFADNGETVSTLEDTAVSGNVIDTGLTSGDGAITLTSFQVAGSATAYTAGQTATITGVGTIVIGSNGAYTFTPVANYNGTVPTVTYSLSDDGGATVGDTSTLAITVTAVNDAPAGTDKTITLNEDATYTLSAADFGFTDPNDTPANTLQSVIIASLPGAGTLKLNGVDVTVGQTILAADIANLVYAPAANASGTSYANFTFKVVDNGGTANSGQNTDQSANTITFNVTAVNDPPVDGNETNTVIEDATLTVLAASGLLVNTTDIDGGAASITAYTVNGVAGTPSIGSPFTIPSVGALTINSDGSYTFVPVANYTGAIPVLTYTVSDGAGGTDTSTLTLSITAVNDAPAGTDKTITLNEDATYTLSAADFGFTDPNDTPANTLQSVIIASLPGAGTLKLNGVDVTVGQTILAADIANLVYAPAANASGTSYANFTFKVVDNGGTANSGQNTDQSANTITFNVTAVNDPPVAVDDSYTMLEDGAAITLTPLTSDTDVENNTLTITSINGITLTPGTAQSISVTGGTVNVSTLGVITFIPASNFNGVVTFPYVISDGAGGTATANESITVTAVNDTFADNGETVSTLEDTAVSGNVIDTGLTSGDGAITLTSFQVAGSATAYTAGQTATITGVGTIVIGSNGAYTFTPVANYNGTVPTVTYSLSDDGGATVGDTSTLAITVTAVNDPPVDGNETNTVERDTVLIVTSAGGLLANTSDVEASTLSIAEFTVNGIQYPVTANNPGIAVIAGIGTLTINSDGSYRYEPVSGYAGAIPIATYVVSDGNGGLDTSTLTLRVPSVVPPARNVGQTPFIPHTPLYQPIEMGKYEFHTVVLDFNGKSGGINQFSLPAVESTMSRGDLQYSNHTPYYNFDRVGDEVANAQRSIDANLSLPSEVDTGLRNPLLPPDIIPDAKGQVSYVIPPGTFAGGKGDIQLKVFTKDGKPLPDWIKFDPAKGKLDIALPGGVKESVELQVVATDSKGDQAKTKLKIKPVEKPAQKTEFKGKTSLSSQIKSALMLRG